MGDDALTMLEREASALDSSDGAAVRSLASRVVALVDPCDAERVCKRSRALRHAVGALRADNLAVLLGREHTHDEFIRRTADPTYMAHVDVTTLRVPRFVAVTDHACECGRSFMVPYHRQGGPAYGFDCPACGVAWMVTTVFADGVYAARLERDDRPSRKRRRRAR